MSSFGMRITHPSLESLRPVLQAWVDGIEQYVQLFAGNDLPYWYNERANVGMLSGAAWKAGWVALEEFQSQKMRNPNQCANRTPTSAEPYRGRCDLYVANHDVEFFIEAKACYPLITNITHGLDEGMQLIQDDARNVDAAKGQHLSALFCAPYAPHAPASDEVVAAHLAYAQRCQADAHAWVAPVRAQNTCSYNGCYYPLVSLFLKLA